jgi:hypothetical protein
MTVRYLLARGCGSLSIAAFVSGALAMRANLTFCAKQITASPRTSIRSAGRLSAAMQGVHQARFPHRGNRQIARLARFDSAPVVDRPTLGIFISSSRRDAEVEKCATLRNQGELLMNFALLAPFAAILYLGLHIMGQISAHTTIFVSQKLIAYLHRRPRRWQSPIGIRLPLR